MFTIIFLSLLFGFVAWAIGQKKGEGCFGFLAGALFGPFGILIILMVSGNRQPCPSCKEMIQKTATVCPRCQRETGFVSTFTCQSCGKVQPLAEQHQLPPNPDRYAPQIVCAECHEKRGAA